MRGGGVHTHTHRVTHTHTHTHTHRAVMMAVERMVVAAMAVVWRYSAGAAEPLVLINNKRRVKC